jgi:RNA polymerase sigma-70 factor (ECF subfamily)
MRNVTDATGSALRVLPASRGTDGDPAREAHPATTPDPGDADLVQRARQGDDEAFAGLVRRHEARLVRFLHRMVEDLELARDLAQETFWRVYTRLDSFDVTRRFEPWLFQVGVYLAVDELRRRKARSRGPGRTVSLDQARSPGGARLDVADPDPRGRHELAQEVRHVLDLLPLPYRTVLVLRDLEGFSTGEIAAIVRKREATVRWRLAKARDLFRTQWERRQDEGSPPHAGFAVNPPGTDADLPEVDGPAHPFPTSPQPAGGVSHAG